MTTGKGQNANLVMIFLCAYIFFISPFELSTRDRKKEKRDSPYISVSNKRSHMFRWAIALAADMGRLGPLLWYMSWPAIKGQPAAAAAPRWEKRSENLTDTNRSVSHMNIFQWPPHACSDGEDGRTWFVGSSPSGTWLGKRWVFFSCISPLDLCANRDSDSYTLKMWFLDQSIRYWWNLMVDFFFK